MRKWWLSLFLVLVSSPLWGENGAEAIVVSRPMCMGQEMPSGLVNQSVCALSGNYVEQVKDLEVPGYLPTTLSRSYCSSDRSERSIGKAWAINHPVLFRAGMEQGHRAVKDQKNKERVVTEVIQPSGGTALFYSNYFHKFTKQAVSKLKLSKLMGGFSNTSGGALSAQTNLLNTQLHFQFPEKVMDLTTGSGLRRRYFKSPIHGKNGLRFYLLDKEFQTNGTQIHYSYNPSRKFVEEIQTVAPGGQKLGAISFTQKSDQSGPNYIRATASTGQYVDYFLRPGTTPADGEVNNYITEVHPSHGPPTRYTYSTCRSFSPRVEGVERPGGRYLATHYYEYGKNDFDPKRVVKIRETRDRRTSRVAFQKAPAGPGGRAITTHRYFYRYGSTKVLDPYDTATYYIGNSLGLLGRIETLDLCPEKGNVQVSAQKFYWGKEGTFQQGFFKGKAILGSDDSVQRITQFHYDLKGNVKTKVLIGSLTTHGGPKPIVDNKDGTLLEPCELWTDYYDYSQDGRHLLTKEWDEQGRSLLYRYKSQSDHLIAKLECAHGEIQKRTFYDYDEQGFPTLEIQDNGSSEERDDLSQCTVRKIKRVFPTQQAPFGLPEVIEESYWDFERGEEQLLSRIQCTYNELGLCTNQEHFDGEGDFLYQQSFFYNQWNQLTRTEDSRGPVHITEYDEAGLPALVSQKSGRMKKKTVYDYMDRPIREEWISEGEVKESIVKQYDLIGQLIHMTNNHGESIDFTYNRMGNMIKRWERTKGSHSYVYDIFGNVIQERELGQRPTETFYNDRDLPTLKITPDGNEERWTYYTFGKVHKHCSPKGILTTFTYDAFQRVLEERTHDREGEEIRSKQFVYDGLNLLEEHQSTGLSSYYSYDGAGRLIQKREVSDGVERVEEYGYDACGRLASTHKWVGDTPADHCHLFQEYDLFGQVIEERTEDGLGAILSQTQYTYDLDGNQTSTTRFDAQGRPCTEQKEFDAFGRTTSITDPQGNKTFLEHERIPGSSHEISKWVTTKTDPLGNQVITTKDEEGRVLDEKKLDNYGTLLSHSAWIHTPMGLMVERIDDVVQEGKVKESRSTFYSYDVMKRVTEQRITHGDQTQTTYTHYDRYGQVTVIENPDGTSLFHEYDGMGRLARLHSSDHTLDDHYSYDDADRIIAVRDALTGKETRREYDGLGRLIHEQLANGLSLSWELDELGTTKKLTLPDASAIVYDKRGSALNSVSRLDPSGKERYRYTIKERDLSGRILQAQMVGKAGLLQIEWDASHRLKAIHTPHWRERIPSNGYDSLGRLCTTEVNGEKFHYTYNGLNQLQEESHLPQGKYRYDSLDNRLSQGETDYQIGPFNQLTQVGESTLDYDLNGNTSQIQGWQLEHDALGRLTSLTREGETIRYGYDFEHRRLWRSHSQGGEEQMERYLYDDKCELGAFGKELRVLSSTVDLGAAVAIEQGEEFYAPVHNHRGDLCALINGKTGEKVFHSHYSAFGEIFDQEGEALSPWGFNSKRRDRETGWNFFGRRDYSPDLGRWLTPDPSGFSDGPNLYAFVHNNPLAAVDLWGLKTFSQLNQELSNQCKLMPESGKELPTDPVAPGKRPSYHKRSENYVYRTDPVKDGIFIVTVNGIWTEKSGLQDIMHMVSEQFNGSQVYATHNYSYGTLPDLLSAATSISCFRHSVTVLSNLLNSCMDALDENGGKGSVLMFPHSEGCNVTYMALSKLAPERRNKYIDVHAFAPGKYVPANLCRKAINYVHEDDPVPVLTSPNGKESYNIYTISSKPQQQSKSWISKKTESHYFSNPEYQNIIKQVGATL